MLNKELRTQNKHVIDNEFTGFQSELRSNLNKGNVRLTEGIWQQIK